MPSRIVEVTPTITAGAYTQLDSVGGVFSVRIGPSECTLMKVMIVDEADQGPSFELWVFRSEPTGVADNAAFSLSDADAKLVVGIYTLDTWFDGIDAQILSVDNIGDPISSDNGTYYLMLKDTDATPGTFVAVDDLTIKLGVVY